MSRFSIVDTPIAGLKIVQRQMQTDARGFFERMFCAEDLRAEWDRPIAQINHTVTQRPGAVRGLHFQYPPHAEAKLISCIRGEVWDVGVDLRMGSPTFRTWFGINLSPENGRALLIPEGIAHGFQALSAYSELIYFHSRAYNVASEGAVSAEDPSLAISWPLPVSELSARDQSHPALSSSFQGIAL
jgi:dTDP-4-dehydrorhamnose 3,5-epimerase